MPPLNVVNYIKLFLPLMFIICCRVNYTIIIIIIIIITLDNVYDSVICYKSLRKFTGFI